MTTLIHNCTALLMDEGFTVLPGAFVTVEGRSITSVGKERPESTFDREIDGGGHVLMPGLVNAHTHVPMSLFRGYGGGVDLHTWLHQYIFPAEAKLDNRAIRAGTQLGLAELISSGVTLIADMYDHCHEICRAVTEAGISANISRGTTLFAPEFDPATNPAILEAKSLVEEWHGYGDGQILVDVSIHGEYTSRPALWETLADLARSRGLGMHVHVSETRAEHEACLARSGKTPIQTLDQFGVWESRALAAHCVWTTPEDWYLMGSKGVTAVHNPASNLKLGSGVAPIPAMRRAGVRIALGTDGASSNNSLDLFGEMKLAALLHNGVNHDPLSLLPQEGLRMATCEGAEALGRNTGRIAPGYTADLILVDFDRPNLIPCHSVADNLVYAARGGDVVMNMARGEVIYKDGVFFTLNLEQARREVRDYALPLLFG